MSKPNFSGTWKLNRRESVLQIASPDSTLFVIDHREPHLRISRTHIVGDATLVFDTKVARGGEAGTNVVRYNLSVSLESLIAEECFRSRVLSYDNKWVLDKVSPGG